MKIIKFAALVVLVIACGVLLRGQITPVTNQAGVPFPTIQYQPTTFTAESKTSDMIGQNFYRGNVEIRTPGIILRADEAIHNLKTGQIELRGTITAATVPVQLIWPEPQR